MTNAQTGLINSDPGLDRRSESDFFVGLDAPLRRSFDHCTAVTRARARNFYYGMMLMPQPKRSAMYAVYAFMRACDDLADAPETGADSRSPDQGAAASTTLAGIDAFRQRMTRVLQGGRLPDDADLPEGDIWPAFSHVMRTYPIDVQPLHDMLDGQVLDLQQHRYAKFSDLYDYCYKVASTVGLVCISVWGAADDPAVRKLAEHRGIALQLTNILRDLVEDARRDRVYLPAEELTEHGYDDGTFIESMRRGEADDRFDRLMAFQIERAASYYEKAKSLEGHLDPVCRPTCWAMMRIYRGLLDRIARRPRRVLTQRVSLSKWQKLGIALHATLKRGLKR